MKTIIFSCLLAAVVAAPQGGYYDKSGIYRPYNYNYNHYNPSHLNHVPITSQTNEVNPDGSYSYSYTSGDGKQAQETGYLKNAGVPGAEAQVVHGSYAYTAPDGTPISVRYVADENGFRAEGAHLPTPPPIPEAIAKSLAYNAQHERNNPHYNNNQYDNQNGYYDQSGQYRPYNKPYNPAYNYNAYNPAPYNPKPYQPYKPYRHY